VLSEASSDGEVPAVVGRRPGTAGSGHRARYECLSRCPGPSACAPWAQASPLLVFNQWIGGVGVPRTRWWNREAEPTC